MAIIVEEEKGNGSASRIFIWVFFLAIIGIGVWYLFFTEPQAAILPAPQSVTAIAPLAQLNINPESVTSNPTYTSLKTYVTSPSAQGPSPVGRTNPFIAP